VAASHWVGGDMYIGVQKKKAHSRDETERKTFGDGRGDLISWDNRGESKSFLVDLWH